MKKKKTNGVRTKSEPLSLETLKFTPYPEVRREVFNKVGKMPTFPKDLPKGVWTEQAVKVLEERYLVKDTRGKIVETPDELCWRVAWEIASADARWGAKRKEVFELTREYFKILVTHEFLPNSPTLMNAGTGNNLQYSACFVLPVEDSLVGIFDAIKYQALIHQTGGGTGFAFSRLRPRGSMVKSSRGVASGPVSFMRIFDAATNEVKQGGKRRGANMGILRVDHPDILEFIHCKEDGGITNFNISVAITDKFMKAYEKNGKYDLVDPKDGKVVGRLSARKVFDEIADGAWRTGDPGLVFIDRINKGTANPVPGLGPVESTNPCGEQPLYPYDSCNLGSIFLGYLVKEKNGRKTLDWDRLGRVVALSVRFLDGVIEMNPYTIPQIRQTSLAIRRIGLGVGGWADMLISLGIPFDSVEALDMANKVMKFIQEKGVEESEQLAKERGAFPLFSQSIYKRPRRNSTVTTIAPTGSISIIAGASSGIEPLFAIAFQHIVKDKHLNRKLTFINPKLVEIAKEKGFWTDEIRQRVEGEGVIRNIEGIPSNVKALFGTAHEIDPEWHIKTQAVFQKYTENAVSKTINLRHDSTVEDIKKAYLLAWETSCKGITVFRDGCKDAQVLNLGIKEKKEEVIETEPLRVRPFKVTGSTYKLQTPVGTAFITINQDENASPLEIFVNVGKAGSDVAAMAEALGRTISTALRFRGSLMPRERAMEIATQLAGIGGRRSVGFGPNKIRSLPDAISFALSTHYGFKLNGDARNYYAVNGEAGAVMVAQSPAQGQAPKEGLLVDPVAAPAETANGANGNGELSAKSNGVKPSPEINLIQETTTPQIYLPSGQPVGDLCPSCGASSLVYEEGCAKCYSCGHSEC